MEILFLGTSSGTPTKTRNVSAVALKYKNSKSWSLVDCGEGTQHQILNTSLSLINLQSIFITHVHGDHCYGLPGLLASASMLGRTTELLIVGPDSIKDYVENIQKTTQLRLSYDINFINVESSFGLLNDQEFTVETVKLSHRVPSFAFVFSEKNIAGKLNIPKLEKDGIEPKTHWGDIQKGLDVLLPDGRKISGADYLLAARKPRKIIIAGDNDNPELLAEESKSADVLVHEATYTESTAIKIGKGPQHSSAKQVAQFAEENMLSSLILTHFSPRYQSNHDLNPSIKDIENEALQYYSGNLFLADDFDVYHLDITGKLAKI